MVTESPDPVDAWVGDRVVFTAAGSAPSGAGEILYYWRKDGVTVMPAPHIMGDHSPTLVIDFITTDDAGLYDAVVSNTCGYIGTSSALLRVFCRADFNMSGVVSVQDIFDFLAAYFANDIRADFNRSTEVSVQDIFDFLAAYFAGCA